MNRKTIITALIVIVSITANAQFLFRISGGGQEKTSFMLGTFHLLPGSLLDSIPEYQEAETNCVQVYAEIDADARMKKGGQMNTGQQGAKLTDGKTIFDLLSNEQVDFLNAKFKEVLHYNLTDSTMKALWNLQPLEICSIFEAFISLMEMYRHGLSMSVVPIDAVCVSRAKKRGMKLGELDERQSLDSLIMSMNKTDDSMIQDMDSQVDSLMTYIENFEQHKRLIVKDTQESAQVAEYWKKGDYDSFACNGYFLDVVEKSPGVYRQRNEKWLPKMQAAMREAPTLFVFGSAHLIGPNGIMQMLRNAGYKVEQIKRNSKQ